jgi:hypothetical protein
MFDYINKLKRGSQCYDSSFSFLLTITRRFKQQIQRKTFINPESVKTIEIESIPFRMLSIPYSSKDLALMIKKRTSKNEENFLTFISFLLKRC